MIEVPGELKKLAEIFRKNGYKLYAVGGFVRDSLLGVKNSKGEDFDICSKATPEVIEKMLYKTEFKLEPLSKELGVLKILGENKYEHATFRRETYTNSSHIPTKVEFIQSLKEDAERRDFKINSIYYDILSEEVIDPLGGEEDIKNKTITTTKDPRLVFDDDPERVLRLIRLSCSLGFTIKEEELEFAKKFAENIVYISRGRVRKEFQKMLVADTFYPEIEETKGAHIKAIEMLEDFGILQYIFPLLHEANTSNKYNYNGKKYYAYILNHLKKAKPSIRLALIFFDFTNLKESKNQKKDFDKRAFVKKIVEENIGEKVTNFPAQTKSKVIKTVLGYDFYKTLFMTNKKIRRFVFDNYDALNDIIELKSFVHLPEKEDKKRVLSIQILKETKREMENEKVIFDKEDLNITGKEVIREFPKIKLELLSEFMTEIAGKMAETQTKNDKETIIVTGNKVINSKRDYWLDK